MHALDAHLYSRYFRKSIFAIQTQRTPSIDIIDHWLIFPFFSIKSIKNSLSSCSQLSIDSISKFVYQSKAFPLSERTNCFTMRPP
ncbi:hypothetical protein ACB092_09G042500 [Castanea dentata]